MKKFKHAMQGYLNEVVEGADGGGAVAILDEPDGSPQDAVLAELGLADAVKEVQHAEIDAKPEVKKEPETVEAKAGENPAEAAKPESITEADLEPLNSKNQGTIERFRKVTEGYKSEKTRADGLSEQVRLGQESFDSLRELGFSDENAANDLVNFASFRKALGSGDVETVRQAIADVVKKFEAAHGKRIAVTASVLDDYPEIKGQVDDFTMPEATALEIIRGRKVQEYQQSADNQRNQRANEDAQHDVVIGQAVESVKALQANWEKIDPDFVAIMPLLHPQMEEIARNFPPSQWPQIVDMQYKTLKRTMSAQASKRPQGENPLRGNGHKLGMAAPSTPQEAVLQELGLSD